MRLISNLKKIFQSSAPNSIEPIIVSYIQESYPSNHCYTVDGRDLIPYYKLAKRFNTIQKLYPESLSSLIDLSFCKGYFVFEAAKRASCLRAVGIDTCEKNLLVCDNIKGSINDTKSHFENMYLHELASQVDDKFGGAFQTALMINTYQYLFFGSDSNPNGYLDHDVIFGHISRICEGRLIFNNRTELVDCQNRKQIALAGKKALNYSTNKILESASRYFRIVVISQLGGYPLWVLDKL